MNAPRPNGQGEENPIQNLTYIS